MANKFCKWRRWYKNKRDGISLQQERSLISIHCKYFGLLQQEVKKIKQRALPRWP